MKTQTIELKEKCRIEIGNKSYYIFIKYIIETEKYISIKHEKISYSEASEMMLDIHKLPSCHEIKIFNSKDLVYSFKNSDILCQVSDDHVMGKYLFLIKYEPKQVDKTTSARRAAIKFENDKIYSARFDECIKEEN
jgi:hypothetical protein